MTDAETTSSDHVSPQAEARVQAEAKAYRQAIAWTILLYPVTLALVIILLPARLNDAWRVSVGFGIALAASFVLFEALRLILFRRLARQLTCPTCGMPFAYQRAAHRKFALGYAYDYACSTCGHRKTTFRLGRLREE